MAKAQLQRVAGGAHTEGTGGLAVTLLRDDLMHPYLGGNKLRKLDALLPALSLAGATHLVTCGGLQSAHTAAVAAAAAERRLSAHLLVRGERPAVVTGYHLLARMFGHVTYVPRGEYADRARVLEGGVGALVAGGVPRQQVAVIPEGGACAPALLGFVRLVAALAASGPLAADERVVVVVDSGTGTTAVGMALGCQLLGLPWQVLGVMLAGERDYYEQQAKQLLHSFNAEYGGCLPPAARAALSEAPLPLRWEPRSSPRRFGKVLPGEVAACERVAKATGVLLDPIYSLAGWQAAWSEAREARHCSVVYLHSGGGLGLFGLAQTAPSEF